MYCVYNIIAISFPLSRLILFCAYCFVNDKFSVAYPGILFGGGVQQIQLRTEDKENGDLGVVAP